MKKIKLSSWRSREQFNKMLPLFRKYFTGGGSHLYVEIKKRKIWVYPDFYISVEKKFERSCEGCNFFDNTTIELATAPAPDVFYDWKIGSSNCNPIYVNGKFAGFFCRRLESLFLTDWTHDEKCVQTAKEAFPQLVEKLGLKEIDEDRDILTYPHAKVTLGADPEFEELESWDGYTPHPTTISDSDDSSIGRDGAGWQVEFRPHPSASPEGIVANIKTLIKKVTIPLSVKGDRYPLGGHIHIGLRNAEENEAVVAAIVSALDDFLGSLLIDLSGEARGIYRKLGAWETKSWGFEYRTLPSAFFINPEVARVVFKIVKNVTEKLLHSGVIKYNDTPTLEDYMKIANLTVEEYSSLINFIEEYKNYDGRAINANWLPAGWKPPVKITFWDNWNPEISSFLKQKLGRVKKLRGKVLVFYGLSSTRGRVVSGIELSGYESIPHPIVSPADADVFTGLPYELRTGELTEEKKKILETVIKIIKKEESR